ncbi:potassium-transporting ATPase subunit KdpB [Enterococcus raffinosus]|jgi:K+-transporting ATPase ATPase B chain|uniref:Potassium-transporting ATPase ATP-binding subunit n=1 Tax=Enterococcus raffinosus TaxID=71452 RepID=A0AAW8T3Z9_9ENTE|nr:potassium-transporting ATPase subunit KdpB [Enterococcus raffinosus]MDT2525014.1 potassium-transporting ATPase subunit KdpB [Enterococcus raffinosus]MDT2532868.1 potassium-transporting ATPase subunit KdpB [Enterococcus raffinosus]MDT2543946.1 potassium-transporting ATPase subunit KdpB [Enterococcus raffinosus]MDT2556530.1 potassium-transporting ATPase subunit KdpB [Enterococcus raffinosus]MDT2576678.1 potassium-transporting ATPase subunit KdpB [Enterococcus raffinosus]
MKKIYQWAAGQSFKKLDPRQQIKNPVMFVVYLGAILTTLLCFYPTGVPIWFSIAVTIFLWLTLLFANFAEAVAEGRGKAQADSLKQAKKEVMTYKINSLEDIREENFIELRSSDLKRGDLVYVRSGEQIPADGDVIEGAASVDESAITGESAPVIRESGGDRSAVTGGTTVVSDYLVIRVTSENGQSFLDKMIAMVEGTQRKKTPNEIGLQIFLITLTIIFLTVSITLVPFTDFSSQLSGKGEALSMIIVIALLICLAPTTIGALISSIGIAGMSRLTKENVIAMSGRAIEAAGDVDVLLLDKTGTITLGNRRASEFLPVNGVSEEQLADAAQLSSLADETAEGRSIVILAKERFNLRERAFQQSEVKFIDFSAKTRMSGIDYRGDEIRKGAADTMKKYVQSKGESYPPECDDLVDKIARAGGTPLVVVKNNRVLGVVYLKDIVKNGVKEKFADMRKMGIKTIMITGDNPLTAAAIAAEAGVDDFLAEATPENKMDLIREYQEKGHLVAMTGDGTNDAPALAQADVAMAMNTGTQAAKEAGNMIDLDSSPTKLLQVVQIGKQLLMTRGALTTFSIANDIAKYFAVIPVLFYSIYPQLDRLNLMGLGSPLTAILSAVIYNAVVIVALIPLALKGVNYQEKPASQILRHNLLIYGLGGIIAPFIFIKLIDMVLSLIIL